LEEAELRLQAVERMLSAQSQGAPLSTVLGTTSLIWAYIALFRGDLVRWLTLAHQALEHLSATDVIGRTAANLDIASAFLISGDVTLANQHRLVAAVAGVREIGELSTLFRGIITLAELQRQQGWLRQAAATYREAAQVMPDRVMLQAMPYGANYYFGLGKLLWEWNDLDAAAALLLQGREMVRGKQLAEAGAVVRGYVALARLQWTRGAHDAAIAMLHEFEVLAHERHYVPQLLPRIAAAQAELALLQSDLDAAVQWAETSGLRPDDALSYPRELEYLTLARVRIAQARHDQSGSYRSDALYLLDRLLDAAEGGGRTNSVIEILILRALVFHAQGDAQSALAGLERALALAAPEGYVRIFVDEGVPMAALLAQGLSVKEWGMGPGKQGQDLRGYAGELLAVFRTDGIEPPTGFQQEGSEAHTVARAGEVLTERELEVLRLLVAGYSNQAIAQELIVAVGTVKRHVSNIMSKLGVQSRLEAVACARKLGLV
jgi:LuxR family transcriptional regulator, maltose regulon positive regulatory protein